MSEPILTREEGFGLLWSILFVGCFALSLLAVVAWRWDVAFIAGLMAVVSHRRWRYWVSGGGEKD